MGLEHPSSGRLTKETKVDQPTGKQEAMANYEVNVPKDILPGLLVEKGALPPQRAKLVGGPGLASLIEAVLNQVLEA